MAGDEDDRDKPARHGATGVLPHAPEPPVVARLVVEIRSDGSRTIARGALEDLQSGERVQVHAEGGSPLQLAAQLAKAIFSTPSIARRAVRKLLGPPRKGR